MRHLHGLVIATLCLFLLSACGGSKPATPATGGATPAPAPAADPQQAKYEAAKKEGHLTVYFSSMDEASCAELVNGFKAKYPGIDVDWVKVTGQQAYQRVMQEVDAGIKNADVVTITDVGRLPGMKKKNLLLKYTPVGEDQEIPAFRGLDPEGYYFTHSIDAVLISYNPTQIKKEDLPKKWLDLTDPKYKDKISIGHPGFSGFVGTFFTQMQLNFGDTFVQGLGKNTPLVGRSINDTIPKVISGERAIGISPLGFTLNSKAQGKSIDFILPEDGAIVMQTPSFIMASAPHPNAAKLFQDFLFSADGSTALLKRNNVPIRTDATPPPGAPDMLKIKLQHPTAEQLEKMIPEVQEKFGKYINS